MQMLQKDANVKEYLYLYFCARGHLKIILPCFQVLLYLRTDPIFIPPGKENSDGQGETNLKGHLPPVCIVVVHFTEIICCNTEITNVLIVFEN